MMKWFEIVSGKKIFDLLALRKIRPADIVHNNKFIHQFIGKQRTLQRNQQ